MCEPWLEMPLVTEWTRTTDGRDTIIHATNIEKVRVDIRDMPSVVGNSPDVTTAMNQYDQYVAELQAEEAEKHKRN